MMGLAGLHHFVTVGRFAYLGGACRVHHDVPPFVKVDGADEIRGLNKVGLTRAGFSQEDVKALDWAYRRLFNRKRPLSVALTELEAMNGDLNPNVVEIVEFLRRRDQGKHGRYLEGKRGSATMAAAVAEAAAGAGQGAGTAAAAIARNQAAAESAAIADATKLEAAGAKPPARRGKADVVAVAAPRDADGDGDRDDARGGNGETSHGPNGNIPA
jgi:hypothetical protein